MLSRVNGSCRNIGGEMTIDDLIPDKELNLGGRPPKSEQETEEEEEENFVWLPDKDSEEFWNDVMNELNIDAITENLYNDDRIGSSEISDMADLTCLFTWQIREQLEEHDIHETDWDNVPDDYPIHYRKDEDEMGSSSTGGLSDLIKDKK